MPHIELSKFFALRGRFAEKHIYLNAGASQGMRKPDSFQAVEERPQVSMLLDLFSRSIELKGGNGTMEQQTDLPVDGPVFEAKIGGFKTAVFMHERDGRLVPSVALEKSFKSNGNGWKHQKMSLLNASELDKLICVLQETKMALYKESFKERE
jgi:hypothetical protein